MKRKRSDLILRNSKVKKFGIQKKNHFFFEGVKIFKNRKSFSKIEIITFLANSEPKLQSKLTNFETPKQTFKQTSKTSKQTLKNLKNAHFHFICI